MNIQILQLIEGAQRATGLTVVIDVFRAFSVGCYALGNGAKRIIPVGDLELAYQLKQQNPSFRLLGERGGVKLPGFDYGNSPTEIENVDFRGQTLIQTTSAGTQGIANACGAGEIITGSFVNAPAIVRYVRARNPSTVSLVCMGAAAITPSDEDTLCAESLRDSLENRAPNFTEIRDYLGGYQSAQRFFDIEKAYAPARDFKLCMDLGRFDFVLQAHHEAGAPTVLHRVDV